MANLNGMSPEALSRLQSELALTPEALQAMPDRVLVNAMQKLNFPNRPLLRLRHRVLGMLDDRGLLPDGAEGQARLQLEELRVGLGPRILVAGVPVGDKALSRLMTAAAPGPGLSPANAGWTGLGPGNIGGRTRALLIHPQNSSKLWAGSVGGGVWATDDAGAHWRPCDDLMGNLAVCSLVMDPTNPQILYAGTGEGFSNADAIRGAGIFKTLDGGASWQVLNSTSPDQNPPVLDFYYVNRLVMSSDGCVILAATQTGIFRSTNGGATWTQTLANASIGRVAFAPGDNTKLVASGNSGDGRVYYSINGGVSWTQAVRASAGTGRVDLAYAKANASIVYASVQAAPSELWKSVDGGQTYTKQLAQLSSGSAANFLGSQGWYDNIVWAGDPTNSNLVLVGGIDLFRSTDGGNTFSPISTWWSPSSAHADQHTIIEDPGYNGTTNRQVWFGNDGGMYYTADVTTVGNNAGAPFTNGWVNKNDEYEVTQFYGVAANLATKTVIGGAQDNGTLRYTPANGANNWNSVYGGDGGYVAADPSDPNTYYGEYVYLQIFRNTDGGATSGASSYICGSFWNGAAAQWQWKPAPYTIPDAQNNRALFIAPFVLDPSNVNRLLAGGQSLWRTNDAKTPNTNATGPSWASIKPPVPGNPNISAIVVGPANSDLIYVGYDSGRIDKTINGTNTNPQWQQVSGPIGANRACLRVAIDPKNSSIVFATFAGYQSGNVWKSTDGGTTWKDISAKLPQAPIRAVTIHPTDSNYVYLGSEVGLFVSEDAGAHWSPTNEGPTDSCIYELNWMGTTLLCATHGRGIFQIDLTIHNVATTVITGDATGVITALDGQTGSANATFNAGSALTSPAVVDQNAAYFGAGGTAFGLGAANLTQVWSQNLGNGTIDASPALDVGGPAASDDRLYVATSAGLLFALNPALGTQYWQLNVLNLAPGIYKKIVSCQVMNRWAYLAGEAGVQAIDLYKAAQHQTDPTINPVGWTNPTVASQPPLFAADSVFIPGNAGSLVRVNARSGGVIWSYQPGSQITTAPVWVLGGVCFGDSAGELVIVDFRTGQPMARKSFSGETIEAIVADNQTLYVVTSGSGGTLSSWNVQVQQTGWAMTRNWTLPMPDGASQAPVVVGNVLYATANTGIVYAFSLVAQAPPGGRQLWQHALATAAVASPAPVFG